MSSLRLTIGCLLGLLCLACGPSEELARAQVNQARVGAIELQSAASLCIVQSGTDCPSVEQLLEGGFIQAGDEVDPWDHPFRVSCPDGAVEVRSGGPDGALDTDDDVVEN